MRKKQSLTILLLVLSSMSSTNLSAKPLPEATSYPPALQQTLQQALQQRGPDYVPRTEHLDANGHPDYTNRLISEDSPYLLQHAHNPVDWRPWGAEAFATARRENKPIFLSIGYSTCHWCHVMERESFEDIEVARLLNRDFITIKVDRERRPDVDEVYMTAVMLFSGSGGWPMSSFLTPDGQPFFGGTYFPKRNFIKLLQRVAEVWQEHPQALRDDAEKLAIRVQRQLGSRDQAATLSDHAAREARDQLLARRDEIQGGIGTAPKFPHESELLLLLDRARRHDDQQALDMATDALLAMARGGIHDQIGGGFHRYSTTPDWLVPHFEEMLYNQAQLAQATLSAWELAGDADTRTELSRALRQILDYVLRDMTAANGSFYSATDADSEGEEGLFFLWTQEQIRDALPAADAALIIDLFGVTQRGNFEGSNILHLSESLSDSARQLGLASEALTARVDHALATLYLIREQRIHPGRDAKRVSAWNGMMIAALARAGRLLDEPRYRQAAERAADAILNDNRQTDGGLWRVNLDGSASVRGKLDDYADMIVALLAIYDDSGDNARLRQAEALADRMLKLFSDDSNGALYMSADHDDPLFLRPKQANDGAVPSGNSVALLALSRLSTRSAEPGYQAAANALLGAFATRINQQPIGYPYMLLAAEELRHGETGALRYAAKGKVRLQAQLENRKGDDAKLVLDIHIAPGWHINSSQPRQSDLIATRLSSADDSDLNIGPPHWPTPIERRLGFLDQPLSLYEGQLRIEAPVSGLKAGTRPRVELRLQACSDKVCLPPETMSLTLRTVVSALDIND
jgi:uncharacterized protein YyaL (SSP411 family)